MKTTIRLKTTVKLQDNLEIDLTDLNQLKILSSDLEKLASQEPTKEVKKEMSRAKCRQIDLRVIKVLSNDSPRSKYSWSYGVSDYAKDFGGMIGMYSLGYSQYFAETLERKD